MPQAPVEIALDAIKTGLVASFRRGQPPPTCRFGCIEGAIGTGHGAPNQTHMGRHSRCQVDRVGCAKGGVLFSEGSSMPRATLHRMVAIKKLARPTRQAY